MKILKKLMAKNSDPFGCDQIAIVCLGDSVTQGGFLSYIDYMGRSTGECLPHLVYPRKLEDELWFLFPKATVNVINSGIGGDNSYGMLERFDRDVARYKPDLVTIMLGQNDCCNVDDDIDSKLSAFEKNTEELFRRTLDIGAECIYVTPWMCCKYVDPNMLSGELAEVAFAVSQRQNTDLPDRFVDVAKNVAARMNIPIADAYAEWKLYDRCEIDITQLLANRINHPITKMHDIFVRKIIEQILADGPSD